MWFSGGVAACNMVMTVCWELAHISNGISILQSTSVQRTMSGVYSGFCLNLKQINLKQIGGSLPSVYVPRKKINITPKT